VGMIFQAAGYSLRYLTPDDAQQIFERFTSVPKMMKYLPIKVHDSVEQTEAMLWDFHEMRERDPHSVVTALVQDARPGWIVGLVGIARYQNAVALSLKVHRDGAGAGRVFAPQLVHWLLAHPGTYRVWAYTDVDNRGVENLLTKMGAKCEGTLRRYTVHPNISPEPRDCKVWSIIR
jgi:ribosomal-protein-alanine N-acetyltransferase